MRAAWIAVLMLAHAPVSADVVGPEDPSLVCPNGSWRTTHHCGTVCEPLPCESDADCRGGLECIDDVSLCVNTEPYCGGGATPYDRVYGDCSRPCSAGSCRSLRACGAPPPPVDSGSPADGGATVVTYGCGCRTSGSKTSAPWLLALALLAMARGRSRSASRGA